MIQKRVVVVFRQSKLHDFCFKLIFGDFWCFFTLFVQVFPIIDQKIIIFAAF